MNSGGEGKSLAERVRDLSEREVEVEPGVVLRVAAVSVVDLLGDETVPPVANLRRAAKEEGGEKESLAVIRAALRLGMVEPRVWTGEGECDYAAGYVRLENLRPWELRLFHEIAELSGWEKGIERALSFRGEGGPGDAALGAREGDGAQAAGTLA